MEIDAYLIRFYQKKSGNKDWPLDPISTAIAYNLNSRES